MHFRPRCTKWWRRCATHWWIPPSSSSDYSKRKTSRTPSVRSTSTTSCIPPSIRLPNGWSSPFSAFKPAPKRCSRATAWRRSTSRSSCSVCPTRPCWFSHRLPQWPGHRAPTASDCSMPNSNWSPPTRLRSTQCWPLNSERSRSGTVPIRITMEIDRKSPDSYLSPVAILRFIRWSGISENECFGELWLVIPDAGDTEERVV